MPPFKPDRLAVVSLRAGDVPKTVHFYRDVVGLRLVPHHGHHPALDLGGSYLVIIQGEPPATYASDSSRFPTLAFAVKDLDEAVQHLQTHAVELPWGVEAGAEERWVLFHDPAGYLIEFVQFSQEVNA